MNGSSRTTAEQRVLYFLERIASAEESFAVLEIIHDYLLAWPKERVANLQRMDGGWAPFDRKQNPLPVPTLGHLELFREEVHRQCLALSQEDMPLTPEIIELDEMLTIASRFSKAVGTPEFRALSAELGERTTILKRLQLTGGADCDEA